MERKTGLRVLMLRIDTSVQKLFKKAIAKLLISKG